jgi:hypothetical protein
MMIQPNLIALERLKPTSRGSAAWNFDLFSSVYGEWAPLWRYLPREAACLITKPAF